MGNVVKVGIADWKLCNSPDQITTIGLGSCVGVVIYSQTSNVCGLLHILLPSSLDIKNNSNRSKFADTGLEDMVAALEMKGIKRNKMVAKIAGGATMFQFNTGSELGTIGDRNVAAVKQGLLKYGIPILAEDVGKDFGRTIIFDISTKCLTIKSAGQPDKVV